MSLAWSETPTVAHVMRFVDFSHWRSYCGRFEIDPDDWMPYWDRHPDGPPPVRFTFDDRYPRTKRWCILCDRAAADLVRDLADLPAVRILVGAAPCPN